MCPDTVFINRTLFNVFTKEFVKGQSIGVQNGRIAYVGPEWMSTYGFTQPGEYSSGNEFDRRNSRKSGEMTGGV
jgi:hypothetical protein